MSFSFKSSMTHSPSCSPRVCRTGISYYPGLSELGQEKTSKAVSEGEFQINCKDIIYHSHQSVSPGRADTWKYEIMYRKVEKPNDCWKI